LASQGLSFWTHFSGCYSLRTGNKQRVRIGQTHIKEVEHKGRSPLDLENGKSSWKVPYQTYFEQNGQSLFCHSFSCALSATKASVPPTPHPHKTKSGASCKCIARPCNQKDSKEPLSTPRQSFDISQKKEANRQTKERKEETAANRESNSESSRLQGCDI